MSDEGSSLSIVVPSFQRRDAIVRLIRNLDDALAGEADFDMIVVVDGSDDGTVEALRAQARSVSFPLRYEWQENSGPASARNVGMAKAGGDVIWLLDDDLIVSSAAVAAHRRFHASAVEPSVLSGPTWEQTSDRAFAHAALRRHQRLIDTGRILEATDFWTGNVSLHRSVLDRVGDFDARFSGAAVEDVEFGYRLLKAGVPLAYRADAAIMHDRDREPPAAFDQQRSRGRNLVRLARLHPESLARGPLAAPTPPPIPQLYRIGVRTPRAYGALAAISAVALRVPIGRDSARARRVFRIGSSAARLAGLLDAEASPDVIAAFGFPVHTHGSSAAIPRTADIAQLATLLPTTEVSDARPTMSVVIPTHQRREQLLNLLGSLGAAIDDDATEVVVVVDGSDDGTVEALTDLESTASYQLRWRWQPNRGAAVARNVGVAMARGDVCWFLDDDKTVEPESLAAHVRFHASAEAPSALMGPTWEGGADPKLDRSWMHAIERLSDAGGVTEGSDFRSGNTSVATSALLDVGGFDPSFTGWGEEDVELGYRLLKHGIAVRFDPAARSWHERERTKPDEVRQQRERGHNLVRLCRLHPESIDRRSVAPPTPRQLALLYRLGVRAPVVYGTIASGASLALRHDGLGTERMRRRLLRFGKAAGRIAGLLEAGATPAMVERFGFPG